MIIDRIEVAQEWDALCYAMLRYTMLTRFVNRVVNECDMVVLMEWMWGRAEIDAK